MAGINAPAVKRALKTALDALSGSSLAGVTVSYSYVSKLHEATRELIYFGPRTPASVDLSAMKGSGRVKREETASMTLCIRVTRPGEQDTEDAEERTAAIGAVVENVLATDPTLSGACLKAVVTGYELTSFADDNAARADLDYTLSFDSYLT